MQALRQERRYVMKTNKCLLIIITTVLITFFTAIHHETCNAVSPDEVTGSTWMKWDRPSRTLFVLGFFGGCVKTFKLLGGELRANRGGITGEVMSDEIYDLVVSDLSLRKLAMGNVIYAYILINFSLTDKDGNPLQTK
jgi:hypothetical protein